MGKKEVKVFGSCSVRLLWW